MRFLQYINRAALALRNAADIIISQETTLLLLGKVLADNVKHKEHITSLADVEFKVFSQWGDDGIIQYLIHNLNISTRTFIEFGVADYRESNTRFLMMNNNWSGMVMDGSERNVKSIVHSEYYWKYELLAKAAFVDKDNVNRLISSSGFQGEIGLLHIDLDGNDYWIWDSLTSISPVIAILEYNSVFGIDRSITIPYQKMFHRTEAHYSNLYFGASLRALCHLAESKGYMFIGCNSGGNNAYFVRKDKMTERIRPLLPEEGYVLSKSRQSRDQSGTLTHIAGPARLAVLRGLPVYNTLTRSIEPL